MKTHSKFKSKPGEHGTLYRYTIEYTDDDPAFGREFWSTWAYNLEHALEKFTDSDEGFTPVRAARQRVDSEGTLTSQSSWSWEKV